jgi:glyoxylase-like metal-dependent hydrolase (beta-lactamase superfamily II)
MFAAAAIAIAVAAAAPSPVKAAVAAPRLLLWRLDCGSLAQDNPRPLPWNRGRLPVPCYLIRHGDTYMLWDTGLALAGLNQPADARARLKTPIAAQLANLGVRPDQVGIVAISHLHGDHTGQAGQFPAARLIMGAADLDALQAKPAPRGTDPNHLRPWIAGQAPVTRVATDLDVFGDGSVVILTTPGHTAGHLSLMVKLVSRTVLLTGDLWGSHAGVLTDDMPDWSASRAETLASRDRIRRLVLKHDAMVIIQHEQDDQPKLPPFPTAAN